MKKYMYIGILVIFTFSCKAQIIVPVENKIIFMDVDSDIPEGTYLKDINNRFDKYIGVWKGTYNAKNYEFRVTKFVDKYLNLIEDKLFIRYIIKDVNGVILEDTSTLPNESPYVIKGHYFNKTASYYVLYYMGKNAKCGQKGDIYISRYQDTTNLKMVLSMLPSNDMVLESDCPGFKLAQQILPLNNIVLTKQ